MVYDDFWALRDIELAVFRGERLGVIGRNGAGKTTLLQVIAGVVPPTMGAGTVMGRVAPVLQIGAGFDPDSSGRENVYLNGALLGLDRAELNDRFEAIVDFAELWEFIDVPLRKYSAGMAARLGFAVATAVRPDILLIDEVLAVGDEDFKPKARERVLGFCRQGTTLLLVSHDSSAIETHCSRAIWIERGVIAASGAPSDVMGRYHLFLEERRQRSPSEVS
jgi:ABC-type polysaccharide/polyol phosphate transport system ATPase subunit